MLVDYEGQETENIRWILHCPPSDHNYKSHLARLANDELLYCFSKDTRKSSLTALAREAKKRKLSLK